MYNRLSGANGCNVNKFRKLGYTSNKGWKYNTRGKRMHSVHKLRVRINLHAEGGKYEVIQRSIVDGTDLEI